MSLADLDPVVRRLRRRLWAERVCFGAALSVALGTMAYPRYFPSACTVMVGGRPFVAVADRAAAERVLKAVERGPLPAAVPAAGDAETRGHRDAGTVKPDTGLPASPRLPVPASAVNLAPASLQEARLAPPVTLARGNRVGADVLDEDDAARVLARAVTVLVPRAAILVDGRPVAGLATESDARAALETVRSYYAEQVPELEEQPAFKERVEVRQAPVPAAHCYATPQAAADALRSAPRPGDEHHVHYGETAWEIARHCQLSLEALQRLNPGSALHPLRAGTTLRVRPAPRPPITVIVKRHTRAIQAVAFPTEKKPSTQIPEGRHLLLQPGRPGKVALTTAILYENGVPAGQQLLSREVLVPSRTKVVAVGMRAKSIEN